MNKVKDQAQTPQKAAPSPAVDMPSKTPEKQGGPSAGVPVQRQMGPGATSAESGAPERGRVMRQLQRQAGNNRAGGMLDQTVQREKVVTAPDDVTEREARQVADHATSDINSAPPRISPLPAGMVGRAEKPPEKPPQPVPSPAMGAPIQRVKQVPESKVEEKPVQRAGQKPEQKLESKPVQRAGSKPEQKLESKPVQRATKGTAPSLGESASRAVAEKGPGRPMDSDTQKSLESRLGADLSGVRVHDDTRSQQSAKDLDARAFTHGRDIWLASGESDKDTHLMAHEATHVVQQAGGSEAVQRASKKKGEAGGKKEKKGKKEEYDPEEHGTIVGNSIKIPLISIPKFKHKRHGKNYQNMTLSRKRPDTKQSSQWDTEVRSGVKDAIDKKLQGAQFIQDQASSPKVYFLKAKRRNVYLFGTKEKLANETLKPYWDKAGNERFFQVDHQLEVQLGGEDKHTNYELLDSKANAASGTYIQKEIQGRVNKTASFFVGPNKKFKSHPGFESLRKNYTIVFEKADGKLDFPSDAQERGEEHFWTTDKVKEGAHLEMMRPMTVKEVDDSGLRGSPTELVIYSSSGGGKPRTVKWPKNAKSGQPFPVRKKKFYPGFDLTEVMYKPGDKADGNKVGYIRGKVFEETKKKNSIEPVLLDPWDFRSTAGVNGGYIDDTIIMNILAKYLDNYPGMSPIQWREARLDDERGLVAVGQVIPTVQLFEKIGIDLVIEGDEIKLSKLFDAGELKLPSPFLITGSSLELFAGNKGIGVNGEVSFEIERVGQGRLGAGFKTGLGKEDGGFAVGGEFTFDKNLFKGDAKVEAWYKNNAFGAKGTLSIEEGQVKGIKSATIEASFEEGKFDAKGAAQLTIPGVKEGELSVTYSEKEGLAIGGSFQLADNIPGIKGGSVEAMVRQKPGGEGYDVKASGKAEPKIPGVNANLEVSYDNGFLTIQGQAAYEKGMLKGNILVGATNRPVDANGKPQEGGQPSKKFIAYGEGSVTVRLAPWLQGSVGITVLPQGEVKVIGIVKAPTSLDLIKSPLPELDKEVVKLSLPRIPIIGFSVFGKSVGIFAEISGGLGVWGRLGPLQLTDVSLSIEYNPDHEDQTHVVGTARLVAPASAGLRLFVEGKVGASILVVEASGSVTLNGALGLEASLSLPFNVDWTPASGLVIDAGVKASVQPKFSLSVTFKFEVVVDYLFGEKTLYDPDWTKPLGEFGPNMSLGVTIPVHYDEGKGLDFSWDKVQFEYPTIDFKSLASDVIDRVV